MKRIRKSVAATAVDMVRRYGVIGGSRRARDREDQAQTEETARFWQRVELEIGVLWAKSCQK